MLVINDIQAYYLSLMAILHLYFSYYDNSTVNLRTLVTATSLLPAATVVVSHHTPPNSVLLVCALVSNQSPDYSQGGCYHDNASSYNVTNRLPLVYDLIPLSNPISLDGISNGVLLTHSCKFRCLPSFNGINEGYYSPNIKFTLLSSGHLHRKGGSYTTIHTSERIGTDFLSGWHPHGFPYFVQ